MNPRITYKGSGVDIEAGNKFARRISGLARTTRRAGVLGGIGGFGGLFALSKAHKEPVLVAGTDGVGTKLKIAFAAGRHDTVGIDLVAMCVNDILTLGAEPLFFLDYFATGRLDRRTGAAIIKGIAAGCRQAGCALLGGETAGDAVLLSGGRVRPRRVSPSASSSGRRSSTGERSVPATFSSACRPRGFTATDTPSLGRSSSTPPVSPSTSASLAFPSRSATSFSPRREFTSRVSFPSSGTMSSMESPTSPEAGSPGTSRGSSLPMRRRHRPVRLDAPADLSPDRGSRESSPGPRCFASSTWESALFSPCPRSAPLVLDELKRMRERPRVIGEIVRGKKRGSLCRLSGSGSGFSAPDGGRTSRPFSTPRGPSYPARVAVVISDNPHAYAIQRAREHGVPAELILPASFPDRIQHDLAVAQRLEEHGVGLVALAGYMRIVSPSSSAVFPAGS